MRVFPVTVADEDIREAVVEWSEHLAAGAFREALAMFPPHPEDGYPADPDELRSWISNYGYDVPRKDGRTFAITSVRERADAAEVIGKIDVDRTNLYGLDPRAYVGMVHYDDVPLNGDRSDLTARFYIKRLGAEQITLEFLSIHVM